MLAILGGAIQRARASLLILVMLWVGGIWAFQSMPKESNPDITIPFVYVSVSHDGISPEDAERLLVRPLEQELRALEGLKKLKAVASEGHASVTLEFQAGFDPDQALREVREKVDSAKPQLPSDSEEPTIREINVSQFPVLTLSLSGPLSEVELVYMARELKRYLEAIPEILSVDIGGDREDLLELVADPQVLEQYGISYSQLFNFISNNNRLVAAGAIESEAGRVVVKVPGLLETLPDLLTMPVKSIAGETVTFGDIATVQRTFKQAESLARIDGRPAIVLEISKRAGANILEAIGKARYVTERVSEELPEAVKITYLYDESDSIISMLGDLLNNVAFAVLLVFIILIAALGPRSALWVGLTIPSAFLAGLLILKLLGFTLNIVVLFSLILVAGMLVDGAIVVAEYAQREVDRGVAARAAYLRAANRMAWPVIASTATTLAVFLPLLFWPGMVGQFMSYLPATVIVMLLASLLMALVFLPVMGAVFGRRLRGLADESGPVADSDFIDLDLNQARQGKAGAGMRLYQSILKTILDAPAKSFLLFLLILVACYTSYGRFHHGLEFFPEVEPESAQLLIRARGDLSIEEKDAMVRLAEARVTGFSEIESVYTRTLGRADRELGEDVIGQLTFNFRDWDERRNADLILNDLRAALKGLPLQFEFRKKDDGPGSGKPLLVRVSGNQTDLGVAVLELRERMQRVEGIVDISDNRPLPGIEWRLLVDREQAARYDVDIATLGNVVQLATAGLKLADYRPEEVDDEVDIRLRLPERDRILDKLLGQTVSTAKGPIPISNFTRLEPVARTGTIHRLDSERTLTVRADVAAGFTADDRLRALQNVLEEDPIDAVSIRFAGEDEDQKETMAFLGSAFLLALVLMALILIMQFNSVYQAMLVLSAIVFSTAGVLLGLLVTAQPFGVVMVGLGLIALAGIVVNNNIILIDTYNMIRRRVADPVQAALLTGAIRLRPVLLTAITTVLGLMPMVLGINVDLLDRNLGIGAPSTQWWTQLSSAIAGGLTFATFLTLLITPCLLVIGERIRARLGALAGRKQSSVFAETESSGHSPASERWLSPNAIRQPREESAELD